MKREYEREIVDKRVRLSGCYITLQQLVHAPGCSRYFECPESHEKCSEHLGAATALAWTVAQRIHTFVYQLSDTMAMEDLSTERSTLNKIIALSSRLGYEVDFAKEALHLDRTGNHNKRVDILNVFKDIKGNLLYIQGVVSDAFCDLEVKQRGY